MTMSLEEVAVHADTLARRLAEEKHKVELGHYDHSVSANLRLITALEGRVAELRDQILAAQSIQATTTAPAAAPVWMA